MKANELSGEKKKVKANESAETKKVKTYELSAETSSVKASESVETSTVKASESVETSTVKASESVETKTVKASGIIGSNVLILSDAAICGVVSNLIVSEKTRKVAALVVLMEDENDSEVKYLPIRSIYQCGQDLLTVKYPHSLVTSRPSGTESYINLAAFDENGTALGFVTDMIICEWQLQSIMVGEKELSPALVLSRSLNIVIFKREGSKLKLTKGAARVPRAKKSAPRKVTVTAVTAKPVVETKTKTADVTPEPAVEAKVKTIDATPESAVETAVEIMPEFPIDATAEVIPEISDKVQPIVVLPAPVKANPMELYSFLFGRSVLKDVRTLSGKSVVPVGSIITPEIVENARANGVIAQLALFTEGFF